LAGVNESLPFARRAPGVGTVASYVILYAMISLIRTDATDPDFSLLVRHLDADLATRDGNEHGFYAQFNKIDFLRHVVLAYEENVPVACGAFKKFSQNSSEIKRMYTDPKSRGRGIATKVLRELERWAAELGFETCVLETGKRQPEAISLYTKNGYHQIPNYGQYQGVDNSVCFEKKI